MKHWIFGVALAVSLLTSCAWARGSRRHAPLIADCLPFMDVDRPANNVWICNDPNYVVCKPEERGYCEIQFNDPRVKLMIARPISDEQTYTKWCLRRK